MVRLKLEPQPDGTARVIVKSPLSEIAAAIAVALAIEGLFKPGALPEHK
jgi:hypothetical protein